MVIREILRRGKVIVWRGFSRPLFLSSGRNFLDKSLEALGQIAVRKRPGYFEPKYQSSKWSRYSNLFSLYLSLHCLVLFTSLKLYNWLFIPLEMSKLNLNFLYYISVVFSRLSGSKSIGRCSTNRRYVSIYQENLHLAKTCRSHSQRIALACHDHAT